MRPRSLSAGTATNTRIVTPKRDAAPGGHREKEDRDRERDRDRDRNRDRDRDRDGDRAKSRDSGHEHSKRRREDSRERGRDGDAKRARRSRSRERGSTRDREREPARRASDRDREPSKRSDDRRPDDRDRRSERERDHDRDRDRRPDRGSSRDRDRDRDRERVERHSSRRPEDNEAAANGTKADSHAEENGVGDPEEGEVLPGAPEAKQKTEVHCQFVKPDLITPQETPCVCKHLLLKVLRLCIEPCAGQTIACCRSSQSNWISNAFLGCCRSRCPWRNW